MVPGGKDGSDSIAKAVKQTQEAVSNFNKIGTDLQKSAEGFDDAWTKLLTTTPEQYRALKEAEQLTKDMQAAVAGTTPQFVNPVTGLINYDALLTGRPASAASQPTQMVFNIQSLNVQADDPRSLANQFFDVNYRVSSLSK